MKLMKRFIAAALSILVGTFGYTIVDQAVEDRVTLLESEVVELKEEVSKYHPQYSEIKTTIPKATKPPTQESTTKYPFTPLPVGSYLTEYGSSVRKFLVRENISGYYDYISPNNYVPVSLVSRHEPITAAPGCGPFVAEHYVYINGASAQITDISESVSYKYSYDKDYSYVSEPIDQTITEITVVCTGYTDPELAGKKIVLKTTFNNDIYVLYDSDSSLFKKEIISNTINPDGSFEYKVIYQTTVTYFSIDDFAFKDIQITK